MSDDQRVYSDEEFALILRQATEWVNRAEAHGPSSSGLTLGEMKAAAAQAGLDPELVERAARILLPNTSPSGFERLTGGPIRHCRELHFPVTLDEAGAARLLATVQIRADQPGNGGSSPMGMFWHAQDEMEVLSVTARPEEGGTSITVRFDRLGTFAVVQLGILLGFLAAVFGGMVIAGEVGTVAGAVASVSGTSGIVALARGYWASSTKRGRERIIGVMDALGQSIVRSGNPPTSAGMIGDHSGDVDGETGKFGGAVGT
jgi:hypothetical protein